MGDVTLLEGILAWEGEGGQRLWRMSQSRLRWMLEVAYPTAQSEKAKLLPIKEVNSSCP